MTACQQAQVGAGRRVDLNRGQGHNDQVQELVPGPPTPHEAGLRPHRPPGYHQLPGRHAGPPGPIVYPPITHFRSRPRSRGHTQSTRDLTLAGSRTSCTPLSYQRLNGTSTQRLPRMQHGCFNPIFSQQREKKTDWAMIGGGGPRRRL